MHKIFEIIGNVEGKNILLLQGPMGNFFNRLDKLFVEHGANTFRIGLNAGDEFFADANHFTPYRGKLDDWELFIEKFFKDHAVDIIFLFGDCRVYQEKAIKVAKTIGVKVYVFEEGYIRPDFITLEEDGVNDNSKLPRDREFYDSLEYNSKKGCKRKDLKHFGNTYGAMAIQATIYYLVANMLFFRYPYYQHHRKFSIMLEALYGIRNLFRKYWYKIIERNKIKLFKTIYNKQYYFVALQAYEDFQVKRHSDFNSIEEFISEVLLSFSKFAPKETFIVFKHHPMDRGKKNYKRFITKLAKELECQERVFVVYDLHLPTLLKNTIATITINSTVGISSLYHKTPTICLGRAFYDIKGLTSKGIKIDDFWENYQPVDYTLFQKYRCYLVEKTQINASFYKES